MLKIYTNSFILLLKFYQFLSLLFHLYFEHFPTLTLIVNITYYACFLIHKFKKSFKFLLKYNMQILQANILQNEIAQNGMKRNNSFSIHPYLLCPCLKRNHFQFLYSSLFFYLHPYLKLILIFYYFFIYQV